MGLERIVCRVAAGQTGHRLDQFLAQAFSSRFSRRRIRRLIEAGAVYVDGKRVRVASREVRPEMRIEIYVDEQVAAAPAAIGPERVLYEDVDLIAVDKPSGCPAQATVADAVHDLFAQVRRFLAERDGAPPYLALHHRLDRGTSGVMVFAKRRRANRGLAAAFAEQRVRKVYHALTAAASPRLPGETWTVRSRLGPLRGEGRRRVAAVESGGRVAETELRALRVFPGAVWVEAVPKTGRTHQIRVHLADSGLPVLGDALYGDAAAPRIAAPRLMLHALSVTLEHPVTGAALCIESPLPEDFRQEIRGLERAAATPGSA